MSIYLPRESAIAKTIVRCVHDPTGIISQQTDMMEVDARPRSQLRSRSSNSIAMETTQEMAPIILVTFVRVMPGGLQHHRQPLLSLCGIPLRHIEDFTVGRTDIDPIVASLCGSEHPLRLGWVIARATDSPIGGLYIHLPIFSDSLRASFRDRIQRPAATMLIGMLTIRHVSTAGDSTILIITTIPFMWSGP
jgi:hypothetical protein